MPTENADMRVRDVSVTDDELSVALVDGRTISVPLAWYPRLATEAPPSRGPLPPQSGGSSWLSRSTAPP